MIWSILQLRLKRTDALPLYRQIARALHWRISTGDLPTGTVLPSTRLAASIWKVNRHTVRRAYSELASGGWTHTRPSGRTIVQAGMVHGSEPEAGFSAKLHKFVEGVEREAAVRYGIDRVTLGRILTGSEHDPSVTPAPVSVLECNPVQAEVIARQLEQRWEVRTRVFLIGGEETPPDGPTIGTLFHYDEIRERWPALSRWVRFLALGPDPLIRYTLESRPAKDRSAPIIVLSERAESYARNLCVDLSASLPEGRFSLVPAVEKDPDRIIERWGAANLVLVPPRIWSRMSAAQRAHEALVPIRYLVDPHDLGAVGRAFGWLEKRSTA